MTFAYGQPDVLVTLEPVKPVRGLKPMTRRIYSRYGRTRERTVQEMCDAIGGDVVYVEVQVGSGNVVVPVHSWRRRAFAGSADEGGRLTYAADLLLDCANGNLPVVVYGADRIRWKLSLSNIKQSSARDALDAEPDSVSPPVTAGNAPRAAAAMREVF